MSENALCGGPINTRCEIQRDAKWGVEILQPSVKRIVTTIETVTAVTLLDHSTSIRGFTVRFTLFTGFTSPSLSQRPQRGIAYPRHFTCACICTYAHV